MKVLEIKTSTLFNLDCANDNILSIFFFFLIIDLYFLIPEVFTQIFSTIAELVIPTGIPTKETKTEMEVSAQYNSKAYKLFHTSYLLIHFALFLQFNNFLFHLYFSV